MNAPRFLVTLAIGLALSACNGKTVHPAMVAQDSPAESTPAQVASSYEQEIVGGMRDVLNLAYTYCMRIYPRPTAEECIRKLKLGIGNSFDAHTAFLDKKSNQSFREQMQNGGFGGIGIQMQKLPGKSGAILVVSAMEGTPAEKAGILPSDIIEAISGDGGKVFVETRSMKDVDEFVRRARGAPGTEVILRIRRIGNPNELTFRIVREKITVINVSGETIMMDGKYYALVRIKQFSENTMADVKAKYAEAQRLASTKGYALSGLILNGEDNLGGLLFEAYGLADLFQEKSGYIFIRENDGTTTVVPERKHMTPGDITGGLPILMVVNGGCASACEIVAGSLQLNNRATIASTDEFTFGKGLVQNTAPVGQYESMKWTSGEYYIGDEHRSMPVQCIGIKADIVFSYDGVKNPKRLRECDLPDPVQSLGPIPGSEKVLPMKEVNPEHFHVAEHMLLAWKKHILPKKLADEARMKALEDTARLNSDKE